MGTAISSSHLMLLFMLLVVSRPSARVESFSLSNSLSSATSYSLPPLFTSLYPTTTSWRKHFVGCERRSFLCATTSPGHVYDKSGKGIQDAGAINDFRRTQQSNYEGVSDMEVMDDELDYEDNDDNSEFTPRKFTNAKNDNEWMFFDTAKINVKGGDGGDGCMAMRRLTPIVPRYFYPPLHILSASVLSIVLKFCSRPTTVLSWFGPTIRNPAISLFSFYSIFILLHLHFQTRYREFRLEFGGPCGGNGGNGGSVYIECDSNLNTLALLRRKVHHKASH